MTDNTDHTPSNHGKSWITTDGSSERTNIVHTTGASVYKARQHNKHTPSAHSDTTHTTTSQNTTAPEHTQLGSLTDTTQYWRPLISCVIVAGVGFIIGLGGIAGYMTNPHQLWTYVISTGGILYVGLRLGAGYYVHKDATVVSECAQIEDLSNSGPKQSLWDPNPVLWGVGMIALPPGSEIGLTAGYLYRRHQHVGLNKSQFTESRD